MSQPLPRGFVDVAGLGGFQADIPAAEAARRRANAVRRVRSRLVLASALAASAAIVLFIFTH